MPDAPNPPPKLTADSSETPDDVARAPVTADPETAPEPAIEPAELERLRARAAEADRFDDRLKRVQAEFVNESRRIARQAEQDRRFAIEGVAKDLVPVCEGLDAALAAGGAVPAAQALAEGVRLVAAQLEETLKRHGIELIRPTGEAFDPQAHEAILMVERADLAPNRVAGVIRPGLRLHGRVVRPAQVSVSKAPASPSGAAGQAAG